MTTAVEHKYEIGDRVVVTGDQRRWGHGFGNGTVGRIEDTYVSSQGERGYVISDGSDYWWVAEFDVQLADEPLAEREKELLYGEAIVAMRETLAEADMVNHPPHYTSHPKGIECIDVIEDGPHFNLNQAIRYVWRVNWGGKWDDVEDLRKAAWYLEREIDRRSK